MVFRDWWLKENMNGGRRGWTLLWRFGWCIPKVVFHFCVIRDVDILMWPGRLPIILLCFCEKRWNTVCPDILLWMSLSVWKNWIRKKGGWPSVGVRSRRTGLRRLLIGTIKEISTMHFGILIKKWPDWPKPAMQNIKVSRCNILDLCREAGWLNMMPDNMPEWLPLSGRRPMAWLFT